MQIGAELRVVSRNPEMKTPNLWIPTLGDRQFRYPTAALRRRCQQLLTVFQHPAAAFANFRRLMADAPVAGKLLIWLNYLCEQKREFQPSSTLPPSPRVALWGRH
jgi:hypothetical protein